MGQEEYKNEEVNEMQKNTVKNENGDASNERNVKNKMEAMQMRINELKEKVKSEGELLHNEASSKLDLEPTLDESLADLKNNFESKSVIDENGSENNSLYYSASNYSLDSCASSTDFTYNNFTNFVKSFVQNQDPKERLSLLQLHSRKQISYNMMRHSLTELDARCSEELHLIERSLHHLERLAAEFDVNISNASEQPSRTALELYNNQSENNELQVIWP